MRLKTFVLATVLQTVPFSATADMQAGMEYFSWREFRDSGELMLEESGPRGFLEVGGRWGESGLLFAQTRLRGYLGFLEYAGEYLDGTPVTTETWYFGGTGELLLGVRPFGGTAVVLGGGVDHWARMLRGDGGYQENYLVRFARLGLESAPGRWHGGFGLLAPLEVHESVDLYDGVELAPQPYPWFYAHLAWEMERSRAFTSILVLSYSGYRFNASPGAMITADGELLDLDGDGTDDPYVQQPQSHSDAVSLALEIRF